MALTPLTQRRIANFKANRRGYWSLWIFLALFVLSLFAEFIANDKPILIWYDGAPHVPVFQSYPETAFGGEFPTEADYRDPYLQEKIAEKGWVVWPLIPYSYKTVAWDLPVPAPSPPDSDHWLGTDDQARDVMARPDLRLPHLRHFRPDPYHSQRRYRRRSRCAAGLLWRLV